METLTSNLNYMANDRISIDSAISIQRHRFMPTDSLLLSGFLSLAIGSIFVPCQENFMSNSSIEIVDMSTAPVQSQKRVEKRRHARQSGSYMSEKQWAEYFGESDIESSFENDPVTEGDFIKTNSSKYISQLEKWL